MDRRDAAIAVALVVAGLVVGAAVGYGVGATTGDDGRERVASTAEMEGHLVWVGGEIAGVNGNTLLVNTSRYQDDPLAVSTADGRVYDCAPDRDGVSCVGGAEVTDDDVGVAVCMAVRVDDGTVELSKAFLNATCSMVPP